MVHDVQTLQLAREKFHQLVRGPPRLLMDTRRRVRPFDPRHPTRRHLSLVPLQKVHPTHPPLPEPLDVPLKRPPPLMLVDPQSPLRQL